jgi:hypothetical protein
LVKAVRPPSELRNKGRHVTTLSIDNLPLGMTKQHLLDLIDQTGFEGRYDFVCLPFNSDKTTNQGHAIVNLRSLQDAKAFFAAWHGARVVGVDGSFDGPVLTLAVCKSQGFESCRMRWMACSVGDPHSCCFVARGGGQQ